MKKIVVSDVTLRVIESQGISLMFREKLSIAEKLNACKLDAIELPNLKDSKENEIIFRTISSSVKDVMVKIPVGESIDSVKKAYEVISNANNYCLQVVMPVSTAMMEYNHHVKAQAMQTKISELIREAKSLSNNVEFVAVDAFRADEDFLVGCAISACENGANSITLRDDAGEALPEDYERLVSKIKNACDINVLVCPSNAFAMASASAIKAINAGADGVCTSVLDGNLSLPVFADIIKAKKFDLNSDISVDQTNVKSIVNAIVGTLKVEDVGEVDIANNQPIPNSANIKDVSSLIKQMGYELSDADVGKVFEEFSKVATKKELIDLKELEAIIASTAMQVPSTYHLVNYVVNSGNIIPSTANITLDKNGEKFTGVSTGDGPIDASFHAIEQIIGHHYELDDFQVHAVTKGRSAVGSSIIRLRANGKLYPGNGVSTDIVGACIRAYINALNKIVYEEK